MKRFAMASALAFSDQEFDLSTLRVDVFYFGRHYSAARVTKLTPRAIVAEWTLKSGRTIARRFALNATPSARKRGGYSLPTLAWQSADAVTKATTAFTTFRELVTAPSNYRPTLLAEGLQSLLANSYDEAQQRRKDPRRAHRRPGT